MATVPLHPMLVHLPLALAVLLPVGALAVLLLTRAGRAGSGAWLAVVAAQALLAGSALLALRSGEGEEERVEDRIAESAIERHEEAATVFVIAAGVVLLMAAPALAGPQRLRRVLMAGTVAGTVVVAALGVRTGKAGGELVYGPSGLSAANSIQEAGRGGGEDREIRHEP